MGGVSLEKIDNSKDGFIDALGLSFFQKIKFQKILKKVAMKSVRSVKKELNFTFDEIRKALEESKKFSEAIIILWKNRKKELSLEELAKTSFLLLRISELLPHIKLIEERGTPVLIFSDECEKWSENNLSCKGCVGELGCWKLFNLLEIVRLNNLPVTSFMEYYLRFSWINTQINVILSIKSIEEIKERKLEDPTSLNSLV